MRMLFAVPLVVLLGCGSTSSTKQDLPPTIEQSVTRALPVGTPRKFVEAYGQLLLERSKANVPLCQRDEIVLKQILSSRGRGPAFYNLSGSEFHKRVLAYREEVKQQTGSYPSGVDLLELELALPVLRSQPDWRIVQQYLTYCDYVRKSDPQITITTTFAEYCADPKAGITTGRIQLP